MMYVPASLTSRIQDGHEITMRRKRFEEEGSLYQFTCSCGKGDDPEYDGWAPAYTAEFSALLHQIDPEDKLNTSEMEDIAAEFYG